MIAWIVTSAAGRSSKSAAAASRISRLASSGRRRRRFARGSAPRVFSRSSRSQRVARRRRRHGRRGRPNDKGKDRQRHHLGRDDPGDLYTGTGELSGGATATLIATGNGHATVTDGKLTLDTGKGSLANHKLTATFSGSGTLGGGHTFIYRGTYR